MYSAQMQRVHTPKQIHSNSSITLLHKIFLVMLQNKINRFEYTYINIYYFAVKQNQQFNKNK